MQVLNKLKLFFLFSIFSFCCLISSFAGDISSPMTRTSNGYAVELTSTDFDEALCLITRNHFPEIISYSNIFSLSDETLDEEKFYNITDTIAMAVIKHPATSNEELIVERNNIYIIDKINNTLPSAENFFVFANDTPKAEMVAFSQKQGIKINKVSDLIDTSNIPQDPNGIPVNIYFETVGDFNNPDSEKMITADLVAYGDDDTYFVYSETITGKIVDGITIEGAKDRLLKTLQRISKIHLL